MNRTTPATLTASTPDDLTGVAAPVTVETLAANAAAAAATAATSTPVTPDPAPAPAPPVAPPAAPAPATPPAEATAAPVVTAAASVVTGAPSTPARSTRPATVTAAAALVAAVNRGEADPSTLRAALADIVPGAANHGSKIADGDWIGALWSGVTFRRRWVEALSSGRPVAGLKVKGYRWNPAPAVDAYDGDKAAVPSNAAKTELVEVDVERLAGAHDLDRAFWDLGDDEFIQSYWEAMSESYAVKSDALARTAVTAAAGTATADSGNGLATIVAAALKVIPVGPPTFVAIGSGVFADVAKTSTTDALALLGGSLTLAGEGTLGGLTVWVDPGVEASTAIAGIGSGASFHELGTPLRVNLANIPNGGIDAGLFGYAATVVHKAAAFGAAKMTAPGVVAAPAK